MYSYIKDNEQNNKTAKGIKKIVVKKNIEQEDYKQTLFNNRQMYHKPFEATIINLGAM